MNDELERLLDEARESSPAVRLPTYRDAIAAHGAEAGDDNAIRHLGPTAGGAQKSAQKKSLFAWR